MKWFARKRKGSEWYPKAHILRSTGDELVALCWFGVSSKQAIFVDQFYEGESCGVCARMRDSRRTN